ncbi:MAG: hypothetical protein SGI91_01180 [Alphaproteobacteria bacterium]|nr:hypothetical protein [Alphaproteobacteria bacterium]
MKDEAKAVGEVGALRIEVSTSPAALADGVKRTQSLLDQFAARLAAPAAMSASAGSLFRTALAEGNSEG